MKASRDMFTELDAAKLEVLRGKNVKVFCARVGKAVALSYNVFRTFGCAASVAACNAIPSLQT